MLSRIITTLKHLDWLMMLSVVLLIAFGLTELYSVSFSQGEAEMANFYKQFIFVLIGLGLVFTVAMIDYYIFYSFNNYFYLLGVLLLVLVLLFGVTINNTTGWFYVAGLSLQPVEFVKFFLIIFLARYFADSSIRRQLALKHIILTGGGTLLFVALIFLQPDLGSAALLLATWLFMLIFVGVPKRFIAGLLLLFALISTVAWQFFLVPYQKDRILTFINPESNFTQDYNINQAIIAVGGGGLLGQGLGFGSQSQLRFLPEAKNDFIFAVIAEELGFVGVMVVLVLFGVFFWRITRNLPKIKNDFGIFFMLGASGLIFVEMFVNIAMNMGLLPVVGIGLPFLSYGGSAMIAHLIMLGVIQSIVVRARSA